MSKPVQLNIAAIDLAVVLDETDREFVVMRLIDDTGMRLDVPMLREHAAAFGASLHGYATNDANDDWR
jgi:hypothetical protein